jgi:23S rRNA (cytosine1962-C5)-methyltransferase
MWNFTQESLGDPDKYIDQLIRQRIKKAIARRKDDPLLKSTNAYRLVHAESDLIPGLVVDQYADIVVVQFLSYGVEHRKKLIIDILGEFLNRGLIFERSDAEVRELEGLQKRTGIVFQQGGGELVTTIKEHGINYQINFQEGHKTGFYLDQRDNRSWLRQYSNDKIILDCFSYSGGFSLNAIAGGAKSISAVDSSEEALDQLSENLILNNLDAGLVELVQNDVFNQLRLYRDQRRSFDVIILDPPKFAPTRHLAKKAARGYKDINLLAAKLLRPNGVLFTFSCSGGIDPALFQQIVAGAALDANVDMQIIGKMHQASDHPVLSSFPEGEYLKGLILKKIAHS